MYKLLKAGKANALSTERALKLADVGFVFDASGFRRGRRTLDEQKPQRVRSPRILGYPSLRQHVQDPAPNQRLNPHIQSLPQLQTPNIQNIQCPVLKFKVLF